jgi:hypothetical protein
MSSADDEQDRPAAAAATAAALDKVTNAAATGVVKVADALDKVTGGLFEQRLAETGGRVADTLRAMGDADPDPPPDSDAPPDRRP